MEMPGRTYASISIGSKFGFNGKQNDDEVYGKGNWQDYGARLYNTRLGRFPSSDPLTSNYPWYTPYQFAGNNPIWAIDVDGLEEYVKTFRYENGHATQLGTVKNSYTVRESIVVNRYGTYRDVVYDRRTGKPMDPAEIGQVQFHYKNGAGDDLHIRRNYDGSYGAGDNEMMSLGQNNFFGSVYIGPNNPTYTDANGKEQPDYRREPTDEEDGRAMQHDMRYDAARAAGAGDAFFNKGLIPADKELVTGSEAVLRKRAMGGTDNVTGRPVSASTASRASAVRGLFKYILSAPAFKGNLPADDGQGPKKNIK